MTKSPCGSSSGVVRDKRHGVRSGWHRVWCSVVQLVANLLRALPNNEAFLDEALEFLTVFHPRLTAALSTGAALAPESGGGGGVGVGVGGFSASSASHARLFAAGSPAPVRVPLCLGLPSV